MAHFYSQSLLLTLKGISGLGRYVAALLPFLPLLLVSIGKERECVIYSNSDKKEALSLVGCGYKEDNSIMVFILVYFRAFDFL